MVGNALVGQSGGPTSVINSSLAGVIEAVKKSPHINQVFGMQYGIQGFMEEKMFNLTSQPEEVVQGLRKTPGSALGSSRHKVQDSDLPRILEVLKKYSIRYFFLIGGNDTMDTIHRVERYCREQQYEMRALGIPKTVDNDLFGTHHTPGFPSAARSNILNVKQSNVLARDMQKVDQFVIYQTIGRDAGWLAASTALAREADDDGPHLIYMPEIPFDKEKFLTDAKAMFERFGWVSIVCGEGIKYADGRPVSASTVTDKFSNTEFGAMGGSSVGMQLHRMLTEAFGWRGEFQITESLIMSAFDRSEPQDLEEAYQCGIEAVQRAEKGESGMMITLLETHTGSGIYTYGTCPLSTAAGEAKPMPKEYFEPSGTYPSQAFLEYCKPLISSLPAFTRLAPVFVSSEG